MNKRFYSDLDGRIRYIDGMNEIEAVKELGGTGVVFEEVGKVSLEKLYVRDELVRLSARLTFDDKPMMDEIKRWLTC